MPAAPEGLFLRAWSREEACDDAGFRLSGSTVAWTRGILHKPQVTLGAASQWVPCRASWCFPGQL